MKNKRFLVKAIQALPKLSKESLIKFCKELIYEQYSLLDILETSPVAVSISFEEQLIFENSLYVQIVQEIPNIVLKTGIQSFQDFQNIDRLFYVVRKNIENYTVVYLMELTPFFQENITTKTQDSLVALETLAAGISHEIKNPLSAIDIHTQLLLNKIHNKKITVSEDIQKYLCIVKEESDRLLSVLDIFLNITRKSKPNLLFTEISLILDKINSLLEPELSQKNIILIIKKEVVPKIFTSPYILQQIILDLLRNSIEALSGQTHKQINISLEENNTKTHIVISIDDSGVGIGSNKIYKIFDPYFTTKMEGTGLGLTLVKKMVEELGGEIFVAKSQLGGAKFELYFPISIEQKLLS
ncbi:MAG: sensor histidine kinase [Brevinema sp.]